MVFCVVGLGFLGGAFLKVILRSLICELEQWYSHMSSSQNDHPYFPQKFAIWIPARWEI